MRPRFILVGIVKAPPTLQTASQSQKEYCAVDIEAHWVDRYNGDIMNIVASYRPIFFGEKAVDVSRNVRQGDVIEVDCSLSSTTKQGNNGAMFLNYSINGISYEHVRMERRADEPPKTKAPLPKIPDKMPNYPQNPNYDRSQGWPEPQSGDDIPF